MDNDNIRILMINDHIHFGGGGDTAFRMERNAYENEGYDVFTFSQAIEKPSEATGRDFVAIESKSHTIRKSGKFLFSPRVSRCFRKTLQFVRPHFISVHLVSKYPLSIYPQLSGYPVVQTLHGPNLFCATSWGCLKDGTACEMGIGTKCFSRGCTSLAGTCLYLFLYKRLLSYVKRNVNLFVCPSRHILASAESLGFLPTELISLGIDDAFTEQPCLVREGPPIVLYVGALAEQKGVHILIDAFKLVLSRVPDARLIIAGRGEMLDSLSKQAENNGLGESIEFLGFVDHLKIANLYRQAHVMAVPSIWKEQFGLIGPEALACGTPCVGSDSGGIPEWLNHGKWGFTVSPREPVELAEKIVTLIENRDLWREFAVNGRQWALRQYSPNTYRENRLRIVKKFVMNIE